MKKPSLKRPTASFVMSAAALVIALGGTSYAAATINGKNIAPGTVSSKQLKDGSVKAKDLSASAKIAGPAGATGPAGAKGADGAKGATGATGLAGAPGAAGTNGVDGQQGPVGDQGEAGIGRWALIGTDGQIIKASDPFFTIKAAYLPLANTLTPPADNSLRAAGNVYIDAGEDLSDNGIVATIVLQNTIDQNNDAITNGRAPGADANPEFSGQIALSKCNFAGATPVIPTNCAPPNTQTNSTFVVSPRNADGSVTVDGARKAFYVIVTGDSSTLPN